MSPIFTTQGSAFGPSGGASGSSSSPTPSSLGPSGGASWSSSTAFFGPSGGASGASFNQMPSLFVPTTPLHSSSSFPGFPSSSFPGHSAGAPSTPSFAHPILNHSAWTAEPTTPLHSSSSFPGFASSILPGHTAGAPSTPSFAHPIWNHSGPTAAPSSTPSFAQPVSNHPVWAAGPHPPPAFGSPSVNPFALSERGWFPTMNHNSPKTYDHEEENLTSISATDAYKNKSHEELRSEDYTHRRNTDPWNTRSMPKPSFAEVGCSACEAFYTTKAQNGPAQTSAVQCIPPTYSINVNVNGQGIPFGVSGGATSTLTFVMNTNCIIPAFELNGGCPGLVSLIPVSGTAVSGFPMAFIPQKPPVSAPPSALPTPFGIQYTNTGWFNVANVGQSNSTAFAPSAPTLANPFTVTSLFTMANGGQSSDSPPPRFGSSASLFGGQSAFAHSAQPFSSTPSTGTSPFTMANGGQSKPVLFGGQSSNSNAFAPSAPTGSTPAMAPTSGTPSRNSEFTVNPFCSVFSSDILPPASNDCPPSKGESDTGLELVIQSLGVNPWAEGDHRKDCQDKQILPCEDASNDADIIALAEFAVAQHNALKEVKVEFSKVERACLEAVDGGKYHIVLQTKAVSSQDPSTGRIYAVVLRNKTDRPNQLTLLEGWTHIKNVV